MKTAFLYLVVILIPILSSCHTQSDDFISKYCPGSCTVIKGRLTTDARNTPLAGITLEVQWKNGDILGFTSTTRRKAIAKTDANGNYELRFLLRDDEMVNEYGRNGAIIVKTHTSTEKYLNCLGANALQVYYNLKRDTTITLNYNLPQKAYVQLQVLNTQAMQEGDYINTELVYDAGEAGGDSDCISGVIWNRNFNYLMTEVAANQQVVLRTNKRKAGTVTVTEAVVSLKPGQTFNYQVTF